MPIDGMFRIDVLPLNFGVEDVLPRIDLATDQVGPDTERIGVVDRRHNGEPLGLVLGELGRARTLHEAHRARRRTLGDDAVGLQLAGGEDRHDLVEQLDLLDVHRLQRVGAEDLLDHPVFDVADIEGVRLRHDALHDRVGIERRHLERDAEVGLALLRDLVDRRYAGAALAQHDVLVVLRPDHREAGDGAAADGRAGDPGRAFEHPAAADAAIRFPSHLVFLLQTSTARGRLPSPSTPERVYVLGIPRQEHRLAGPNGRCIEARLRQRGRQRVESDHIDADLHG